MYDVSEFVFNARENKGVCGICCLLFDARCIGRLCYFMDAVLAY